MGGRRRSRAAFRPFFVWLGAEGCAAIQSVAMDMNTALDPEVRHHCPQAEVVYDLFHVVVWPGGYRPGPRRPANQLRDNPKSRQVIKRSRWLRCATQKTCPKGMR